METLTTVKKKKKERRKGNASAVQVVMKTQKQSKMAPSSH